MTTDKQLAVVLVPAMCQKKNCPNIAEMMEGTATGIICVCRRHANTMAQIYEVLDYTPKDHFVPITRISKLEAKFLRVLLSPRSHEDAKKLLTQLMANIVDIVETMDFSENGSDVNKQIEFTCHLDTPKNEKNSAYRVTLTIDVGDVEE